MVEINNKKIIKKAEVDPKSTKWKRFKNIFWLKLNQNHNYSWMDRIKFGVNFIIGYGGAWLSLYFAVRFTVPEHTKLNIIQWLSISGVSFLLVTLNYLREHVNTWRTDKELKAEKTIYSIIGGAIEVLNEFICNPSTDNPKYVYEILKSIENTFFVILKTYGITPDSLSANLMVLKKEPLRLSLKYFGTKLAGRTKLELPIDPDNPLPGAPEAYVFKKMIYIDNTQSDKYKEYFDAEKEYRSIISIPIIDNVSSEVIAVINVDSPEPKQFISKDFIEKRILHKIHNLILLFSLERNLLNLSNNKNNSFKESK